MKKTFIISVAIIALFATAAFADATRVPGGPVQGSWTEDHSPYIIEGNINVADGQTLTIGPRVIVNFAGHYKLEVNGSLKAVADQGGHSGVSKEDKNAIRFTTDLASNPSGWAGIRFVNAKESKLENCILEHSHSTGDGSDRLGGAIYSENSNPAITNCLIRNNTAVSGGGAACVGGKPFFTNCVFTGNSATEQGGAIFGDKSRINIANCSISQNQAGTFGGGLSLANSSIVRSINATFSQNKSGTMGGALYADASMIDLANGALNANEKGGVAMVNNSTVRLSNCAIRDNTDADRGGAVLCKASALTLTNATINGNSGGGLYLSDASKAELSNCSIRGNGAKSVERDANSIASMTNCSVKD